jgi:hypothetical protein
VKKLWAKDFCPFCRDQGFYSIIGDVALGEQIFGFKLTSTGSAQTVTLSTATAGKVHQMKDEKYRLFITKLDSQVETIPCSYTRTKVNFIMDGDTGTEYDVLIVGKVAF